MSVSKLNMLDALALLHARLETPSDAVDDINPAVPIRRNMINCHSFGSLRYCWIYIINRMIPYN